MFGWLKHRIGMFLLSLDFDADFLLTLRDDRTMSETFARWRRDGNPVQKATGIRMCAALDLVDKGHCDHVLADAEKRDKDDKA